MHVHRIPLDNEEFEGNNNAYLLAGDETILIDTGVATDAVRGQLEAGLADRGVSLADLDRILLTHWHADHAGLAGELQQMSDATVFVHEADAQPVKRGADGWTEQVERLEPLYETWGLPERKRDALDALFEAHSYLRGDFVDITSFTDGDVVVPGKTPITARHLPGHTAGLSGFEVVINGDNVLVAGDALLPQYTPNVGGADVRVPRPLATYLDTLETIASGEYDRVYPGHREPIDKPAVRAKEILEHHRERAERVFAVVHDHGPVDTWTVSANLFGELNGIHILHGPGEAWAHLTHLVQSGVVEETPDGYVSTVEANQVSETSLLGR